MENNYFYLVGAPHLGNADVEDILTEMIDSPFAVHGDLMSNNVRIDSISHMLEDFYAVCGPAEDDKSIRFYHFILELRMSDENYRVIHEAAHALLDWFCMAGHQTVMIPHLENEYDHMNLHWHVVVNPLSYISGNLMLDKMGTYNFLVEFLREVTNTTWTFQIINRVVDERMQLINS